MLTLLRLFICILVIPMSSVHAEGNARAAQRHVALSNSAGVSITGEMDVSLHTGYKKPEIIIYGDPRDLERVDIYRKGNLVQVAMKKKFRRPVRVEVRAKALTRFSFSGRGVITGNKLHTHSFLLYLKNKGTTNLKGSFNLSKLTVNNSGLTLIDGIKNDHLIVDIKGRSRVQLTGFVNLTKVNVHGSGFLGVTWVKSHFLTVRASGSAQVQLAGVANVLDVEIRNKAHFKGRFLRAEKAFVKTHNSSVAEFSALFAQHTLALDNSDIYFYNLSTFRTDFMGNNGAVLDMRPWNSFFMQEYTIYNK